jgi:hypothetical protein
VLVALRPANVIRFRIQKPDICFYLAGGNQTWFAFKSNVATISKSAIGEAFQRRPAPDFNQAQ